MFSVRDLMYVSKLFFKPRRLLLRDFKAWMSAMLPRVLSTDESTVIELKAVGQLGCDQGRTKQDGPFGSVFKDSAPESSQISFRHSSVTRQPTYTFLEECLGFREEANIVGIRRVHLSRPELDQ